MIGNELGLIKLGSIFIDRTKVQANASKHKAMSYKRMKELEIKLECEINQLMKFGQEQDKKDNEFTIDIPEEIKRRKERLIKISAAQKVIEERHKEAYSQEKAEFDKKQKSRKE